MGAGRLGLRRGLRGHLRPGLTILFGAPGAVVFYVVAGVLVALPDSVWSGPRMGRLILGATGALLLCAAALQAWPGRGFWQGTSAGRPGTLAAMAVANAFATSAT